MDTIKIDKIQKALVDCKAQLDFRLKDIKIVETISSASTRAAAVEDINKQIEVIKNNLIKTLEDIK